MRVREHAYDSGVIDIGGTYNPLKFTNPLPQFAELYKVLSSQSSEKSPRLTPHSVLMDIRAPTFLGHHTGQSFYTRLLWSNFYDPNIPTREESRFSPLLDVVHSNDICRYISMSPCQSCLGSTAHYQEPMFTLRKLRPRLRSLEYRHRPRYSLSSHLHDSATSTPNSTEMDS